MDCFMCGMKGHYSWILGFYKPCILLSFLIISSSYSTVAQVCTTAGRLAGLDATHAVISAASLGGTTRTYIMSERGAINCYGVVKEFHFEHDVGACYDMTFQIWEPDAGSTTVFNLVGEYDYPGLTDTRCTQQLGAGTQEVKVLLPVSKQIPVKPGDIIGWKETGDLMLKYDNAGAGETYYSDNTCTSPNTGFTCDTFGNSLTRDYAVRAYVVTGPDPRLDDLPSSVEIYENGVSAPSTEIYTVSASHQSNIPYPDTPDTVTVTLTLDPTYAAEFQMDANGNIETRVSFDYEVQSVYDLVIYAEALDLTVSEILTVYILDLEESHFIDNLDHDMAVSAPNTFTGDSIYTVVSLDSVTLTTVPVYYVIESGVCGVSSRIPFTIDRTTGEVTCTEDLEDWRDSPCVLVIASSDLINRVTGTLTVTITDIKQAPLILYLPQTILVSEAVSPDTVVFQVDVDYPDQNQLIYTLTGVGPATATYLYNFEMDSSTGEIYVVSNPTFDFTLDPSYDLTIEVTNQFGQTHTETLTIQMEWNNRAPYYEPAEYDLTMTEECDGAGPCHNVPPLPTLPHPLTLSNPSLSPMDRDVRTAYDPNPLTCTILTGVGSDRFWSSVFTDGSATVCTQGGDVTLWLDDLNGRIDVDTNPEYKNFDLILRVSDSYGAASTAIIHVTVTDINDNTPQFTAGSYGASVLENSLGGIYLFTVVATDADSGDFGQFKYGIQDRAAPEPRGSYYFQIDPDTGEVTTKHPIDYEQITSITFDITASDPSNTGTATATLVVVDINDNRPVFVCNNRPADEPYDVAPRCFYNMEFRQDSLVGSDVMTVQATDDDLDVSPHFLTYALIKPEEDFSLHSTSGLLQIEDDLRHGFTYLLFAFAYDNSVPNRMSTPLVARIDTYDPRKYLLDITLQIQSGEFNKTSIQTGFLTALRDLLDPWFFKMEGYTVSTDRTVVTVYALCDESTYSYSNLDQPKCFVHRNKLLDELRKDFFGTPSSALDSAAFDPYNPIKVEPTYPIWIIETIPGLVTLGCVCLVFLALCVAVSVFVCYRKDWCCFKPKPPKFRHAWPNKSRRPEQTKPPEPETRPDQPEPETRSQRPERPRSVSRRPSMDSVHSLIYDRFKHQHKF